MANWTRKGSYSSEHDYSTLSPRSKSNDDFSARGFSSFIDFFAISANRDMLWEFMMQEFYDEHMLLYQACINYPNVNDYLTAAQDIQNLYLQPGAVFYCPIPAMQVEKIQQEIETGSPGELLFESLSDLVLQQISQDSFIRFANTERGRAILGIKLASSKRPRTIVESEVVTRSFALATADPGFTNAFNHALSVSCPEGEVLFARTRHPASFIYVFYDVIHLLKTPGRLPQTMKRLATSHIRLGVTVSMLEAFGKALNETVRTYLINLSATEMAAYDRHWSAFWGVIVKEFCSAMLQLAPEQQGFFNSEPDLPKWITPLLAEYYTSANNTLTLVKKRGESFVTSFFPRFIRLTPLSVEKYSNMTKRSKCLLGGMKAMTRLLKKPKRTRKKLLKAAGIHKDLKIKPEECALFIEALIQTLTTELGPAFGPQSAVMWKQYMEMYQLFVAQEPIPNPDLDISATTTFLHGVSFSDSEDRQRDISEGEDKSGPEARPGTFWDVMLNPSHFEKLCKFANDEFKEENLLFYIACTKFAKLPPAELEEAAIQMYGLYLSPAALFQVNVDNKEAKEVMQGLAKQTISATMFDRTKNTILKTIEKDTYARFMGTPAGMAIRGQECAFPPPKRNVKNLLKESNLLKRSFQLSTNSNAAFAETFYNKLLELAPESQILFQRDKEHQATLLLSSVANLISYLRISNEKAWNASLKTLADSHVALGCTKSMFTAFGEALNHTLQFVLNLKPHSLESEALARHWQAIYDMLATEIMQGMQNMVQQAQKSRFASADVAPALAKHFPESKSFSMLTLSLIKRQGEEKFTECVFSRFFSRSAASMQYYSSPASQGKCLWGALNAVVTLYESPAKMRSHVSQIAKLHRTKGVGSVVALEQFVVAIRDAFRHTLGAQYTDTMDAVWKRGLGTFELFAADLRDDEKSMRKPSYLTHQISLARDAKTSPYLFASSADLSVNVTTETASADFEANVVRNLDALQAFAQEEFAEEPLLFYLACVKFAEAAPKLSQADLLESAQDLCNLYYGPAALFNVGVAPSQAKQVLDSLNNQSVNPESFDPGKEATLRVLERDLYKRFSAGPGARTEKDKRKAVQQSGILPRVLRLGTALTNANTAFVKSFYNELFMEVPEARLLLAESPRQVAALRGYFKTMLLFLERSPQTYATPIKRLAEFHYQMAVTEPMLLAFGPAFLSALKNHLHLQEKSKSEWATVERHFRAAHRYVSTDVLDAMLKVDKEPLLAAPDWLQKHSDDVLAQMEQPIRLLASQERAFIEMFYSKFFELSPMSAKRFENFEHQSKAIWGAVRLVADLRSAKMQKGLALLVKIHRSKDISGKEFATFAKAIRLTFQALLRDQYSPRMDLIWKQFLDFAVQYLTNSKHESKAVTDTLELVVPDQDDGSEEDSKTGDSPRASCESANSSSQYVADSHGMLRLSQRGSEEATPRGRLAPREQEFLSQIFVDGKAPSPANLSAFFQFVHKCPVSKRLYVLNHYFMSLYHNTAILGEMVKQDSWKQWVLPICPSTEEADPFNSKERARLMEYTILMLVEVFVFVFRRFHESLGCIPQSETREAITLDFDRRGKELTMGTFCLDATAYLSLVHPRLLVSRILTAIVTKIGSWHAVKPRWTLPIVSEPEWPNFFSLLGAVEEFLFFSSRKAMLLTEREFSVGQGPVFSDMPLVEATCKLIGNLRFDRWDDLPESDGRKLAKLQQSYCARGRQEAQFFNGVRDFFTLCSQGKGQAALPGFVALLMGRKIVYGTKGSVEKVLMRFLEAKK